MRPIDADALKDSLCSALDNCAVKAYFRLRNDATRMRAAINAAIEGAPTIDAEPVRHGRWIHTTREDSDWGGTFHKYTCSACNWSMGGNPTGWGNFCPNCGVKMDMEVKA